MLPDLSKPARGSYVLKQGRGQITIMRAEAAFPEHRMGIYRVGTREMVGR